MSNKSFGSTPSTGGIGFTGLLTVAFVVLKLCGVIDWEWVWVLCPLWINFIIVMAMMVAVAIVSLKAERDIKNEVKSFSKTSKRR